MNQPCSTKDMRVLLEQAKLSLEYVKTLGIKGVECSDKSFSCLENWGKPFQKKTFKENLDSIRADLGDCRRCGLSGSRKNIVFGCGNPEAKLMFIGEAPGYEEDVQGVPFVGDAGKLLTRMIEAMGLKREEVYIANVLKCRPPDNRNPAPEEMVVCLPFLERQIKSINPDVICSLGAVATQALLGSKVGITRLRGNFHDYNGIRLMPTFHPAYLLYNPDSKRNVWEDLQKIMAVMGLKRPRSSS